MYCTEIKYVVFFLKPNKLFGNLMFKPGFSSLHEARIVPAQTIRPKI